MFYQDKEGLARLKDEYSRKEEQPYDLGLRPWWQRKPTASLSGPRAVLEDALPEKYERIPNRRQIFLVREAPQLSRPPEYSPPPLYQEYLP